MIAEIRQRIAGITESAFETYSEGKPGCTGSGKGNVSVRFEGDTIHFRERGEWTNHLEKTMNFTNEYRWSFDEALPAVKLEHLRRGDDDPVCLIRFLPESEGSWVCREPYICGSDEYTAGLYFEKNRIVLEWNITGPQKKNSITRIYS